MIKLKTNDPHAGSLRDLAPDLTPMLDMLFIILVFLMLSSGVIFKALELKLPSSSNSNLEPYQQSNNLLLEIHPDFYLLEEQKITDFNILKQRLDQMDLVSSDKELIIAGDKNVSIETLLNLLTYLQAKQIKTANILMNDENETN